MPIPDFLETKKPERQPLTTHKKKIEGKMLMLTKTIFILNTTDNKLWNIRLHTADLKSLLENYRDSLLAKALLVQT